MVAQNARLSCLYAHDAGHMRFCKITTALIRDKKKKYDMLHSFSSKYNRYVQYCIYYYRIVWLL